MKASTVILVLLILSIKCNGQFNLHFIGVEKEILKEIHAIEIAKDSISALREVNRVETDLYSKGYLIANTDSIHWSQNSANIYLNVGETFHWASIKKGNVEDIALIKSGYRSRILDQKKINAKSIAKLHYALLSYYENNGYPFASSKLTHINYEDALSLSAELKIDKGPIKRIDSIIVIGTAKISKIYLSNYIGIKQGSVYNQSKLSEIDSKLNELSFVKVSRSAQISFTKKYTKLYLFLDHVNSSQFNGILGILPDNVSGKVTITGDAKIVLKNAFTKGELISLNWRKLQSLTQDLDISINYPFMFQGPLGVDGKLKVYKRDTSYIELQQRLGLQYLLSGGNYLMVFFDNYSSSLLDASKYASSSVLPPFADVKFKQYGIAIKQSKLDYLINPRKGIKFDFTGSAGNKIINKNPELNEVLYDDVTLNSFQLKFESTLSYFLAFGKQSTVLLKVRSGQIINKQVFFNELFRLGGLRTLRGFDEESINASLFGIATFEYRFLLERNSNLYLFGDYAYYEKNVLNTHFSDRPIGFGAGIRFQTKPGIFSINYALGSQQGNPVLLKSAKIHFGFVNYF